MIMMTFICPNLSLQQYMTMLSQQLRNSIKAKMRVLDKYPQREPAPIHCYQRLSKHLLLMLKKVSSSSYVGMAEKNVLPTGTLDNAGCCCLVTQLLLIIETHSPWIILYARMDFLGLMRWWWQLDRYNQSDMVYANKVRHKDQTARLFFRLVCPIQKY